MNQTLTSREQLLQETQQLRTRLERLARAEEALRQSEERHRLIADLTSDYTYDGRVEPDGRVIVEVLSEGFTRITGYSVEEFLLHGDWAILIHPDDLSKAMERAPNWRRGVREIQEVRIRRRDGATRWVRYSALPIWDDSAGRIVRLVGAVQDITAHKVAEEEVNTARERLQALSRQLIAAQENERRCLARELHDEIGQVLTAVSINLHALKSICCTAAQPRIEESLAIVDRAVHQVRDLSLDLRPSMLDDLGLAATLRWYVDRQVRRAGLTIHLADHLDTRRLPPGLETVCFRVVQEALTNAVRHARARQVWIGLDREQSRITLTVRDDGIGFDPCQARQRALRGTSCGLLGMQERVEALGGQLRLEAAPGAGTTVQVCLPVE